MRAEIQAYANDFLFMFYISLAAFPIIWLMRRPNFAPGKPVEIEVME